MNPGSLRHRIIFQKVTITKDDDGFAIETWDDYKTVWSAIAKLTGREYFNAMAVQMENTVKFTARYIMDLDSTLNVDSNNTTKAFRIKFNNTILNITSIDDIMFEHKFMEILSISEVV